MNPQQIRDIVTFCSEEVRRQGDGPTWVGYMVDAWLFMMDYATIDTITPEIIREIGARVAPEMNYDGFRDWPIRIGGKTGVYTNKSQIEWVIMDLCKNINNKTMDAQAAYLEFELIHPFGDGNGRTGKILFNWMNKTMWQPVWPENPFNWMVP